MAILLILMCIGLARALREERYGVLAYKMGRAQDHVEEHGLSAPGVTDAS